MASVLDPKDSDVDTEDSDVHTEDSDLDPEDSDLDPKDSDLIPAFDLIRILIDNETDVFSPLPIDDEIDESEAHFNKIKAFEDELAASVPVLFGTIDARRREAKFFLSWDAKPRSNYPVVKACNWSYGDDSWRQPLWCDTWLGMTWVALQCKDDSLCIVVRNSDLLDLERQLVKFRGGVALRKFPELFWITIASNVEDTKERLLASSGLSSSVQPFSLVAVGATGKDQEDLTEEKNLAEATSNFLLEKLKSNPSLTSEEAVQTAILATQYMFGQKFEADEIRVFLWKKDQFIAEELLQKRKNLDFDDPDLDLADLDLEDLLGLGAAGHSNGGTERIDYTEESSPVLCCAHH